MTSFRSAKCISRVKSSGISNNHVVDWANQTLFLWVFIILISSIHSYNVCIRPEDGFCCIQYQVCSDTGSFSLSSIQKPDAADAKALAESSCTSDYIDIPGNYQLQISSMCVYKTTNIAKPLIKQTANCFGIQVNLLLYISVFLMLCIVFLQFCLTIKRGYLWPFLIVLLLQPFEEIFIPALAAQTVY